MKAYLLVAGEGRRLRPLTESVPKCLVPIGDTCLLAIWLRLLERQGVTSILLNLCHLQDRVVSFLETHPTSLAIETVTEPQLLGTAGTVYTNRRFVEGESDFLILYGDNLTNCDLQRIVRFHRARDRALTLGVVPTDRPEEKGTVVMGPGGQVIAFEEKSEDPRSHLANAGIYVAGQRLFEYLEQCSAGNERPFDFGYHVLPRMVPDVGACRLGEDEFLVDIGSPENYEYAKATWPRL